MIVGNLFAYRMGFGKRNQWRYWSQNKNRIACQFKVILRWARNKDEQNYSRSTLLEFNRNGLERYLNNPPYKKDIRIAIDPAFQQSNQMVDAKRKDMKKFGVRQTQTCHWVGRPAVGERERRYQSNNSSRPPIQRLVSCKPVFLSTWTGRAKKLDDVQFSIPSGWKQQMVRNHGRWRGKQNTPRGDRRHRHKLRETWRNAQDRSPEWWI